MLVFSMQLTPVLLAGFYFIFGLFYSIGNANVMTSGLSEVSPEFKPDGNAIFNTCLQFGGAVLHDSFRGSGRRRRRRHR